MINEVLREIAISAELYQRSLSDGALGAIMHELKVFDSRAVCEAIRRCRKELNYFPSISQIIERLPGHEDLSEAEAIDATNRIFTAVAKYGYTNSTAAKNYIGELGWESVRRFGGWQSLCESSMVGDSSLRAQMRQTCLSTKKLAQAGKLNNPPPLQIPKNLIEIE